MSEFKQVNLTKTLEDNFARYAGMVIQDRAIVDVRDGLKPAARQLAYAQFIDKLTYNKPFKKATKSVASGMSHFYVHGDASAYSTLIRMGKPFAMRYPLEEVQGSYGNQMENDNQAASRYVEMKLSELGTHLFDSIEKNTIDQRDWRENYDGTEEYPAVLPSIGFYNLVQGSMGIGVALASSIPQFNLKEMNAALIKLLWNPGIDFEEIYCAPDFCTGGTIINGSEIKESIKNGNGKSIKIRAKIESDYENNQLIVTELPYGVYTNTICKQLTVAMEENPNCGIVKFLDLTGIKPLIKITLEKNANFGAVKDFLYKNTALQSFFSVNMVMLKDGKVPQIFGLKEAMLEYIKHSKQVLKNKTLFELNKAKDRLEIVEGYLKALSIIDEVVALIKAQKNSTMACAALMDTYNFSERQAKAILDLKLNRLVNMEIAKIQEEKNKLIEEINYYNILLTNEKEFLSVIENNLESVSKKYGDDRRTIITDLNEDAEIIEEKPIIAYVSDKGAIIAKNLNSVNTQRRNTVGSKIKFSNKQENIWKTVVGKNTEKILAFTNLGKSYSLSLSDFPIDEEIYINQILELQPNEFLTDILSYDNAQKYKSVVFATKKGLIKKTNIKEYLNAGSRKSGLIAIKIKEDDELISTQLIEDTEEILLISNVGNAVRFDNNLVSPTGRNTMGVKGIKLTGEEFLVNMKTISKKDSQLIIVTKAGNGKRMDLNDINETNRAIKGNSIYKMENDQIADFALINNQTKELVVNTKITSLCIPLSSISLLKKEAKGSSIIKINSDNNAVISISLFKKI